MHLLLFPNQQFAWLWKSISYLLFPFNFIFPLFPMMWFMHLFSNAVLPTWHFLLSPSLIYKLLHFCSPRRTLYPWLWHLDPFFSFWSYPIDFYWNLHLVRLSNFHVTSPVNLSHLAPKSFLIMYSLLGGTWSLHASFLEWPGFPIFFLIRNFGGVYKMSYVAALLCP